MGGEFQNPIDIGNAAAQMCGAEMMDLVLGYTENSKVARILGFLFGKKRQFELRQNVWTFAARITALRAIDTNTMTLVPTLWSGSATYFVGSIVNDGNGTNWVSKVPNNLNNQPPSLSSSSGGTAWEPYFGPLTVSLYDPTVGYFAGELVYTAAGDGTYNVYMSLISGNMVDPSLPNLWSATTTYYQNQVVQTFPAWASGTTYAAGATVSYTDGNTYCSLVGSNHNNIPPSSGASWALVPTLILMTQPVPVTTFVAQPTMSPVTEWNVGTVYSIGSFVLFNGTQYVSIANSNTGNYPNAAASTSWAAMTGGTLSMSLIDLNINNNPASAPAAWAAGTTYATGNKVYSPVTGEIYTSVGNGNINHDPSVDSGANWTNTGVLCPWTTVFTQGGGNDQWMQIGGASFSAGVGLSKLNIIWPVGSGPRSQIGTRNVYRLPSGYLRIASQNPGMGVTMWGGGPTGVTYSDWALTGRLLITSDFGPILFRFVADFQNVAEMDPLFCDGLAASMAEDGAEPLTNSTAKLVNIRATYKEKISIAKLQNGIEQGADEAPDDDYLSVRL